MDFEVSVVICCNGLNRLGSLEETVDSLYKQSFKPKEIIIVYDLIDGLEEALRCRLPTSVLIIPNKFKSGLSLARNTGINKAKGNLVAFIDDDAVAKLDWLENIIGPFTDPCVVGVGGKAIPDWLGLGRPSWFQEEIDWVIGCMYKGFRSDKGIVRNVFGCNMCFRKEELITIGGFSNKLGGQVSGDDTEICLRIVRKNDGYLIIYEPKAIVYHKISEERRTMRYIAYSAWKQGIGKAITRKIHTQDNRVLVSEKEYIKRMLLGFIPSQLSKILINPKKATLSIIAIMIVIIFLGFGYILTRANIIRVRCT